MKILFTGLSSFTGLWFAEALRARGHEVVAGLTRGGIAEYDGLRRRRLDRWKGKVLPRLKFGDAAFIKVLENSGPFDLCCHHGAEVGDYKALTFDPLAAASANVGDAAAACRALAAGGCRALVVTGTYFEAEEGGLPLAEQAAVSPYGLSKTLSWQILRYAAETAGLRAGKFVIPTPFGPWEEPKLPAFLVNKWKEGESPVLQTPLYVRDHVPVDLMAERYALFCEEAVAGAAAQVCRPSGFVETVGAFAGRLAEEFARRARKPFSVGGTEQAAFPEPRRRVNQENLGQPGEAFWDAYYAFYFGTP